METKKLEKESWMVFLKDLAEDVKEVIEGTQSSLSWEVLHIKEGVACISLAFTHEDSEIQELFTMFLSKKYFGTDMVRVVNPNNVPRIMQADADLIAAWISF